jgi:hypothetical protein
MALVIKFLPARTIPPLKRSARKQCKICFRIVTTPLTASHEMLSKTSFLHAVSVGAEKQLSPTTQASFDQFHLAHCYFS